MTKTFMKTRAVITAVMMGLAAFFPAMAESPYLNLDPGAHDDRNLLNRAAKTAETKPLDYLSSAGQPDFFPSVDIVIASALRQPWAKKRTGGSSSFTSLHTIERMAETLVDPRVPGRVPLTVAHSRTLSTRLIPNLARSGGVGALPQVSVSYRNVERISGNLDTANVASFSVGGARSIQYGEAANNRLAIGR